MQPLDIYTDRPRDVSRLKTVLASAFTVEVFDAGSMNRRSPGAVTVFDLGLTDATRLGAIKRWIAKRPAHSKAIFAVDSTSHLETVRAHSVGATHVVPRPLSRQKLLACLDSRQNAASAPHPDGGTKAPLDVTVGLKALDEAFEAVRKDVNLDTPALLRAGESIATQIAATGLMRWIEEVRKHHGQTYQHSMLVTGVAVAFGQHLGFSEDDCLRLSLAGMLHDIGKARIPLEILEKPSSLDYAEIAVMRQHPEFGDDLIAGQPDIPADVRDAVRHHHEYLDGSGYPDGLNDGQIADFVRIITIADIFAALVERRPYKAPMSNDKAYQILQSMGPKIDQDLLREFGFVARLT